MQMGVAKTHDGGVGILITCTIAIHSGVVTLTRRVRNSVGIGTELNHPERQHGAREGVPHVIGTNERVDIARILLRIAN